MKCPHCLVEFHASRSVEELGSDVDERWRILNYTCPSCEKLVLYLRNYRIAPAGGEITKSTRLIHPKAPSRAPLPPEVPPEFGQDYTEACLVLADSPKASAALSRRCLQHLLREHSGVRASSLADEIQKVIDSDKLPSHLAEAIDAVRNIGNFAAHPLKSGKSGEILDVEPGEAEWNLDVLEGLFDFYFVQPAALKKKRDELNKKLKEAGKPPMK